MTLPDAAQKALSAALLGDPSNRAEAKSWLIATIADLQHVPATTRLACFGPPSSMGYDRSRSRSRERHSRRSSSEGGYLRRHNSSSRRRSPTPPEYSRSSRDSRARESIHQQQIDGPLHSSRPATMQLLQLLVDAQPQAVAQLLHQDSNFLCDYLTSSSATISSWFGQFSLSGIQQFKFGARALANYALTHRSDVWEYLVWRGKHDQAPVAVAAKPHYFAELDVPKTLRNLAKYCPGFWCSEELLRSCEGGEWLKLNPGLVAEELHHLLHSPQSFRHQQLLQLVNSYIQSADWAVLCNRLLLLLDEQQLLKVARLLGEQQQQRRSQGQLPAILQQWVDKQAAYNRQKLVARPASLDPATAAAAAACGASQLPCVAELRMLVLAAALGRDVDDLLLANALTCHRSQLLTLLRRGNDDDDAACHLLKLVAVAQELFDPSQQQQQQQPPQQEEGGTVTAAASGVTSSADMLLTIQRLLQHSPPKSKQQHIALVGWLLRLHLLLAAAAGESQWQQALRQLGCSCHPVPGGGGRVHTHKLQQDHQQQTNSREQKHQKLEQKHKHKLLKAGSGVQQQDVVQQQLKQGHQEETMQQQQQQQQQQQGVVPELKPLRRGLPAAVSVGHKLADKKHKVRLKHSRKKHHKARRGLLGKRKRKYTSSSSGSDSKGISGTDSDTEADTPRSINKSKRRKTGKHKAKRKKRRRTSSSSSSSSEWEEGGSEINYDADGELLDPADFQHQQQPPAAALPPAKVLAGGSSSSGLTTPGNLTAQQQLVMALDALDKLSSVGRGLSAAEVLVGLSISQSAGPVGAAAAKPAACVWVSGSAAETADAVAWYCLCYALQL